MAEKKNRFRPSYGQSASTSGTKFKAPTPRIEDVYFTHRTSMAAAEFSKVQSKLSRYVGSNAKGAMGAKATMNLKNPNLAEPIYPICVMKKNQVDGVETEEVSTVPVVIDTLYEFKMEKYMIMWKSWKIKNDS